MLPRGCLVLSLLVSLHLAGALRAQPVPDDPASRLALRRSPVVQVFQAAKDAVVNISAITIVEVRSPWDELFQDLDELFGRIGRAPVRRYASTSLGSGFVIHSKGYIVTNAHVVARTTQRKVIFADQREFPAQILALDEEHDLAILKIEAPEPLPTLPLGTSSDLMVGETVIAIGNPLGYQHTCTVGIISALNRTIQISEELAFHGLIQTDAPINPGNSGGPLLNVLGELIGINTAIRGDAQNIGFAIPVDQLRQLLPEMLDVERRRGFLSGLEVEDVRLADGSIRCRIRAVQNDSPAWQAGIRSAGPLIVALDHQPIRSSIDYLIALLEHRPGDQLQIQLADEQGRCRTVRLTLAPRPAPDGARLLAERFGIRAEEMTPRMARAMNVNGLAGLLITAVEPNSPAATIGLERGDVIIQLGRHPAANLQEVGQILERLRPGQRLAVTVLRIQGRVLLRSTVYLTAR